MIRRWQALSLGAGVLAGCGTQFADPIRNHGSDGPPADASDLADNRGPVEDRCGQWTTSSDCTNDTVHGCSFQPNAVGCHAGEPSCNDGLCRGGDPFVRRYGAALWLHDAPYSFLGAVSWAVAGDASGCRVTTYPSQAAALTRTFDDFADMRVTALRLWAFQSYAGPSGTDYASFDRVVAHARRAGVRLIMVLENYHSDCTVGGQRDDAWFAGGYRAPYGTYALSYLDYVRGLVARYRDEPTIFAWELMHEAEADDFAALDGFASEVSAQIRVLAPHQLIALGADSGNSRATNGTGQPSSFQRLHDHPDIDLLDVHDYNAPEVALTSAMLRDQSIAVALGKPIFVGASAVTLTGSNTAAFASRGDVLTRKIEAALNGGFAGLMIYDYYPAWQAVGWSFDGRREDPLSGAGGIIAQHAPHNR